MQGETSYHHDSLEQQAWDWLTQSGNMGEIANEAGSAVPSALASSLGQQGPVAAVVGTFYGLPGAGMALGDTSLFGALIAAYEQADKALAALAGEGQNEMVGIHDGLKTALMRYQANEDSLSQASQNAGH